MSDARLPIDNNDTEQLLRQVAIGRKNWLFIGSLSAGNRMSDLLTLVSSALRNDVHVWSYVKAVLDALLDGETDYAPTTGPPLIPSTSAPTARKNAATAPTANNSSEPPAEPRKPDRQNMADVNAYVSTPSSSQTASWYFANSDLRGTRDGRFLRQASASVAAFTRPKRANSGGRTSRFSSVEVTRPPRITKAIGYSIS